MIFYNPTNGDPYTAKLNYRPRTIFIMTQLGQPVPRIILEIRQVLEKVAKKYNFSLIDAEANITGKDFLEKIWHIIITVPVGIAIVHEDMGNRTIANIFYELGIMQAYGKETLIIKTSDYNIPSDFVRTEYIEYGNGGFKNKLKKFFVNITSERPQYYLQMAEILEKNPLLSIDYLKRAYLLTNDEALRKKAKEIFNEANIKDRAKNSVENLLIDF